MNTEKELIEQVHAQPYNFICDYVESIYPQTGRRVFEVLSLMPVSLIIPDLPFMNKKIRSNINVLFLAPSGTGKTSLSDLFANLTYAPLKLESITAAKLESTISNLPMFSLIVGDFARMSQHQEVIKVIEGLLGEEKRLSRKTMRKDIEMETEGIGLLCGVATDLHFYILGGLIFRVIPILLGHDVDEHAEIGAHLKNQIGNDTNGGIDKEKIIKDYYDELAIIQNGNHKEWLENRGINMNPIEPVKGYNISQVYREKSYEEWNNLTQPIVKELNLNFFREYQEFYRLLIAHAFLNIFNI